MPEFKSVLIEAEESLPNGRSRPGRVAWVPVNEAAKAHSKAEEAMGIKVDGKPIYAPKPGDFPKEVQARLEARERDANKNLPQAAISGL